MKKLITLICILLITLVFSLNSLAISEYDAMLQILEKTGILSDLDIKAENDEISRAQFLKLASKLSIYPVDTVDVPDFEDVLPSHSAYIAIKEARAKNIISGVGSNYFNPDEKILYDQAVTMIINSLGLKEYALNIGGYPSGYHKIASMLDLNDVKITSGTLTFGNAVEMIYNVLMSGVIDPDILSGDYIEYAQDKEKTYLNAYFDIYHLEGYVDAIGEITSSFEGQGSQNGVVINGQNYIGKSDDYFEYIGRYVGYFYKKHGQSSSNNEFLLMYNTDNDKAWDLANDSINSVLDNRLYYQLGETEKSVKISEYCDVIYNKRFAPDYDLKNITDLKSGRIRLISKNGTNEADLIVIEEIRSAIIKSVNPKQKKIYFEDKTVYGKEEKFIELKEDSFTLKDMDNIDVDLSDLKPGYVVSVLKSDDNLYADVTVTNEKLKVTMAETDEEKLYYNGNEYLISSDFDKQENILMSSNELIFYLDKFGNIVATDDSFAQNEQYGYFVAVVGEKNSNKPLYIRVFDETGKFVDVELNEKIKINNNHKIEDSEIFNQSLFVNGDDFKKQFIKYTLLNGKISQIQTSVDNTAKENYIGYDEDNFSKDYAISSNATSTFRYVSKVVDNKYILDAQTLIFLLPADKENYDEYATVKVGAFSSDVTKIKNLEIYDVDKTKNAKLVVMDKNSVLYEQNAFIVSKITKTTDEKLDEIYRLEGFMGGAEKVLYAEDKANISIGDLLNVSINENDKIVKYEIMASASEYKADKEPVDLASSTNLGSMRVAIRGEVFESSLNSFTILVNQKLSPLAFPKHAECVVYHYFPKTKTVTVGNFSDIADGVRVFVHRYYDSARTVVIYQE